jgi:hypothetical protein
VWDSPAAHQSVSTAGMGRGSGADYGGVRHGRAGLAGWLTGGSQASKAGRGGAGPRLTG